jgi:hypothetical protein
MEYFKSKLPTGMPLETIVEMVGDDMLVPDVSIILTDPEDRMLEEGVRYVGKINPIAGQAGERAENAHPLARCPHGAEEDGRKEVAMSSNVRKAVEDLEVKMKVEEMKNKMKDRKMLVGRKRNVGKTTGKIQQKIEEFLEKGKNGGNVLLGLGHDDACRKRRLSGKNDKFEGTPGKKQR